MKAIRGKLIFAVAILFAPVTAHADVVVGTITGIEGEVLVDAFGTGQYLEAILGEALYAKSYVITAYGGNAIIDVGGKNIELASESTIAIADLLESRDKKKRFRWLTSIVSAVKSVFDAAKGSSEDVVLGGRAGKVDESEVGWITDDEDEDAFDEAMDLVDTGEWGEAVAVLREIVDPLPGTFLPGEIGFWIGHCQYQLENYGEALKGYSDSLSEIEAGPIAPWSLPYYEEALFQTGSSLYFTGDYRDAIAAMESLIPEVSDDYAPFAYMIMIDSLREAGRTVSAKRYLDDARALFTDTEYTSGFDELAGEL
jgi:TolA-binding protein